MKKLALALAIALMIAATACGNSNSPTLSYITRDMSGSSTPAAPQLFKLNESTKQAAPVQIPIPDTAMFLAANSTATAVTYCRDIGTAGASDYEILRMGLDGVEKPLTTNADACESVFSPNGKTMAYVSCASGDCLIMTMNSDGSNQKALYTPPAGTAESFYPEFSADGKSVVFFVITNSGPSAARQPHRNARSSPWLARLSARPVKSRPAAAGTGITQTGWYTMALSDTAPSFVYTPNDWWGPAVFSADGKKLLVTDYDGTTENIYSINLDGSGLTPLTTSTDSNAPDFSPVSYKNLIMFNTYNSTNNSVDVYVMDQDGSNQKIVHSTTDTWEGLIDSYWD
ncbi:MAG TPA: hypothetical protein VM715_20845 [Candidatus Acidoferrum sp.]|jgi:hypothetical protein|nr:hypothetical protein [Candidatus Acidoferrum sp.]